MSSTFIPFCSSTLWQFHIPETKFAVIVYSL